MESTGVSWRPVSHILESSFAVRLVNAQHVKAVPARKIDIRDCQCIAQRLEPGLLRASFVPPAPVRELRELTRSRRPLIPEHAREVNRIQKVLDTAAKGRLRAKAAPFAGGFDRTGYPASRLPTRRPAEPRRVPRTADRALRFSEDPPRTLGEVIDHARQGQLAAERAVRQK
jgi:transposase